MLRLALTLLSSLQIGARIKDTIERIVKQVITLAIAAVMFIAAVVFGLMAGYHALVSIYQFSPTEAATILAAGLLVLGLLLVVIASMMGRKSKQEPRSQVPSPAQGVAMIDQGVNKAMRQVGPLPLLAIAFIAGVLAARR